MKVYGGVIEGAYATELKNQDEK